MAGSTKRREDSDNGWSSTGGERGRGQGAGKGRKKAWLFEIVCADSALSARNAFEGCRSAFARSGGGRDLRSRRPFIKRQKAFAKNVSWSHQFNSHGAHAANAGGRNTESFLGKNSLYGGVEKGRVRIVEGGQGNCLVHHRKRKLHPRRGGEPARGKNVA